MAPAPKPISDKTRRRRRGRGQLGDMPQSEGEKKNAGEISAVDIQGQSLSLKSLWGAGDPRPASHPDIRSHARPGHKRVGADSDLRQFGDDALKVPTTVFIFRSCLSVQKTIIKPLILLD